MHDINEENQVYIFKLFWYVDLIECCDVEAFVAALGGFRLILYITFLLTVIVERLLISHHCFSADPN